MQERGGICLYGGPRSYDGPVSATTTPRRGRLIFLEGETTAEPSTVAEAPPGLAKATGRADGELSLDQRFVDLGEIAEGGMGAVRRVREKTLNREVAMKVLAPHLAGSAHARRRFIEEAQITGQLDHPNIAPVYELGIDDDGTHYFTMKLVRGRTLTEVLKDQGDANDPKDPLADAVQIFLKVCDALSFAHSRGVIHRDIKPANIMVGDHGQVYLMDWGVALYTGADDDAEKKENAVVGTYQFMSPEQASGEPIDARSDIFSLGALLYRVFVGMPPYVSDNRDDLHALAKRCPLRNPRDINPAIPRPLANAIMRAMEKDPALRFSTVSEMRETVEAIFQGRWRFPSRTFPAGTRIITEGESGDKAYVVRSGTCQVFRIKDGQRHVLETMGPGDVFGETAVFTKQPRNANVEALTELEVHVIDGDALENELGLDSWMGAFVRSLGMRFSERSSTVARLQGEVIHERIVSTLLFYIATFGTEAPDGSKEVAFEEAAAFVQEQVGRSPAEIHDVISRVPALDFRPGEAPVIALRQAAKPAL